MGSHVITAILMVKNEADIIAATLTHTLTQVDRIIVADNGSTDGTRDILNDFASAAVTVRDDPDPAYRQSQKMSALAARAADAGATWVVPIDADELWSHPTMTITEFLHEIPTDRAIVRAQLFDYVATGRDDTAEPNPVKRITWRRRTPAKLPKVAVRPTVAVTIHQGNHGAEYFHPDPVGGLIVRHFPYRSPEQMRRKAITGSAALHAAPELPHTSGQHWRDYAELERANPGAIADVFQEWFWVADPTSTNLVRDPCT